jgi:hypothetical protein
MRLIGHAWVCVHCTQSTICKRQQCIWHALRCAHLQRPLLLCTGLVLPTDVLPPHLW